MNKCHPHMYMILTKTHHSEQELTVPHTPSVGEVGKVLSLEQTCSSASSTLVGSAPHVALATPGSEMQEKPARHSANKRRHSFSGFSEEYKRPCHVEYAVLMTEPTNVSTRYTVYIFVCQYCPTSIQVCVSIFLSYIQSNVLLLHTQNRPEELTAFNFILIILCHQL